MEFSQETIERTGADRATLPTKTSEVQDRKIREMPMKKVSRVFDVQKNNQVKNNFTEIGCGSASLLQSIDLESGNEYATTAARDITFDTG